MSGTREEKELLNFADFPNTSAPPQTLRKTFRDVSEILVLGCLLLVVTEANVPWMLYDVVLVVRMVLILALLFVEKVFSGM